MSKKYNVLILASYCDEEDKCTDKNPCVDCLLNCNMALVEVKPDEVIGQMRFVTDLYTKYVKIKKKLNVAQKALTASLKIDDDYS